MSFNGPKKNIKTRAKSLPCAEKKPFGGVLQDGR